MAEASTLLNSQIQSLFFSKLPTEIRMSIYCYAFNISSQSTIYVTERHTMYPMPGLLFSCKRSLIEAGGLFYELCTFAVELGDDVLLLHSPITSRIQRLQIDATVTKYDFPERAKTLQDSTATLLRIFNNGEKLQFLEIHIVIYEVEESAVEPILVQLSNARICGKVMMYGCDERGRQVTSEGVERLNAMYKDSWKAKWLV